MQVRGQHPALAGMPLKYDCAGAVSEENAGGAVLPIHEPGKGLRSYQENVLIGLRFYEGIGNRQSVDESRAGGIDVEGSRILCSELFLYHAAQVRHDHVRCGRRHEDQVQFLRRELCSLERLVGRFIGEVGGGLPFFSYPAFFNAGTLGDPFIARVDELLQIVIGDDFFRGIGPGPRYPCMDHLVLVSSIFFSMSS